MSGFDISFAKIQKLRRVVIPKALMVKLGWKVDDQIIIEDIKGKVVISQVNATIKPLKERL